MTHPCYNRGHESPPNRSYRCNSEESPGLGRPFAGRLVRPPDRGDASVVRRLPSDIFGRTAGGEPDDLDPVGASLESARAEWLVGKGTAGPSHATDAPAAPTVIRAPEAESGALRPAAGSLGWSHPRGAPAPSLRHPLEGAAGSAVAASSRLWLEARHLRLPSGQGRRCPEIPAASKKNSARWARTRCWSLKMRRGLPNILASRACGRGEANPSGSRPAVNTGSGSTFSAGSIPWE